MPFLFDMSEVNVGIAPASCSICPFNSGLKDKLQAPQLLRKATDRKVLIIGGGISTYALMNNKAVMPEYIKPVVDLIPSIFSVYYVPSALCAGDGSIEAATDCCSSNILTLAKDNYEYIIPLGNLGISSLFKRLGYSSYDGLWRGNRIPYKFLNGYVVPTLNYNGIEGEAKPVFALIKSDIEENVLVSYVKEDYNPVIILNDSILDKLQDGDTIAFDYETSGLKPENDGHFIYSISICKLNSSETYSFLLTDSNVVKWKAILENEQIKKIAHNIKMEDKWSRAILNVTVKGWIWDTCIAAHCINSASGNSGLKFQAFTNFGREDYSSHLDPYIKAEGTNGFNKIKDANIKELLTYGAYDAYYTALLYPRQEKLLKARSRGLNGMYSSLVEGVRLFTNVQRAFSLMELNGVKLDIEKLNEYNEKINNSKIGLLDKFKSSKTYYKWYKIYGDKINVDSLTQLQYLLFNKLKYTPTKFTDKGRPSVDEEALADLNIDDFDDFIRYKKYNKITDTYYSQFFREVDENGILHCDMRLNATRTFRTSCTNPNLQNISRSDKEQAFYIRSLFLPKNKDWIIIEADLKGCEVSGAACHTLDNNLIAYVSDSSLDMHRDIGEILYKVDKSLISKDLRSITKTYTFGSFYGSYWKLTGPYLFKQINMQQPKLTDGTPVIDYLKSVGLGTLEDFTAQTQVADNYLWNEQFPQYTQWKRDVVAKYNETGYVDMFTGFRRYGPMNNKQVVNTPIQGDSGHINLWLCLYVLNRLHNSGIPAELFLQIHDSIVGAVHLDYLDTFCSYFNDGIKILRNKWKWMICPFEIEFEVAPVGGSWFDKKEYIYKEGK